jgi:hypothetical protein
MGLDITAMSEVERVDDGSEDHEDVSRLWDGGFEGRLAPLEKGAYRSVGEEASFRAGSYGGYNEWREHLAAMALGMTPERLWTLVKTDPTFAGPFVEQINFTDCDGTIGPTASAKLAKDYADFTERAEEYGKRVGCEWFFPRYKQWRAAFDVAAPNGVVLFG